ncbi:MAG: transaldolase [Proteobacteria bacterium]|nr:transaldolase [Pseudomonadota bacterium]
MTDLPSSDGLKIKIFADGADLDGIQEMYANPMIKGFTTNPTLMRRAGVDDYEAFAREALKIVTDRPMSFEVFADEFDEMEEQALEIASWGANVNVKVPITNTRGESAVPLVGTLSGKGVSVNVTAMFTLEQVQSVVDVLNPETPAILSVFAGRVADSGRDPVPHMKEAVAIASANPKAEVLWASPRELLNIFQADEVGCHIITVTNDVIKKLANVGKDLGQFSLETVKMFYDDAQAAGYSIATAEKYSAE